jgi:site-specific DNA-methyltransferase (adenine-specific)
MIQNRGLKFLVDYPKLFECFPGVEIKGGVCYFLIDREYDGDCEVTTILDGEVTSRAKRDLRSGGDVLIRSNEAVQILDKVSSRKEPSLSTTMSSLNPFELPTNYAAVAYTGVGAISLYLRGDVVQIDRSKIVKNQGWVSKWKVLLPKAGDGHGRVPMKVIGEPIVAPPPSACTMTYFVAGVCSNQIECENLAHYITTKFARFLVAIRKHTQDTNKDKFMFVPLLPMNQRWTDKMLYEKYELTADEINHIESTILEMSI